MLNTTSDGYSWTQASGTKKGNLRCRGVVSPVKRGSSQTKTYDAIVIGAGYAGLAAARDLVTSGRSVLLVEARDRVGGRTYTVEDDDILYEMGGTWVTHHMGYLLKEMMRYNMDRDLMLTHESGHENDYYTINVPGAKPRKLSHEEAGAMTARAWDIFVNIDGVGGRKVCPLPHAGLDNMMVKREDVEELDKMSCADRLEQIKHLLTAEEYGILSGILVHISGGFLHNSSYWDMIRSHALLVYASSNFGDIWTTYKLREGQSTLAYRMFQEAVAFGLEYYFQTAVTSMSDKTTTEGLVEVTTQKDETFLAHKVVSTIPLNVLKTIHFDPPLSHKRQEAIDIGHVNFMQKIHAVVEGPGLASWNGMRTPAPLLFGYGDGVTKNNDAHLVGFGADERDRFVPERHPEQVIKAFNDLHPMNVKKTVFHNWCTDPYSLGGPSWWPPSYMSKYQDELQSRHGNIFFASADWAHGWRAAIDGALEQGSQNAITILREINLQQGRRQNSQPKI